MYLYTINRIRGVNIISSSNVNASKTGRSLCVVSGGGQKGQSRLCLTFLILFTKASKSIRSDRATMTRVLDLVVLFMFGFIRNHWVLSST